MEDHPMSDDFPTSVGAEGRWINRSPGAGGASQDKVFWNPSQSSCEALNHMMREAAARPIAHLGPPSPLFTPLPTIPAIKPAPSVSMVAASSSRRALSRSRSFLSAAPPPSKLLPDTGGKGFGDLAATVAHRVQENAKVKKHFLEKNKSRRTTEESSERISSRKFIARALSEELSDSTNAQSRRSATKEKTRTPSGSSGSSDSQKPFSFPGRTHSSESSPLSARSSDETPLYTPEQPDYGASSPEVMPPPPVPPPAPTRKPSLPKAASVVASGSEASSSRHLQPPPPQAKLANTSVSSRPLVTSKPPSKPPPLQVAPKEMKASQHPVHLRASQSAMPRSTPPPLGMRRAHTTGSSTSGLVPKALPTKQAAFKTPFARSASGDAVNVTLSQRARASSTVAVSRNAVPGPARPVQRPAVAPPPSRSPSPEVNVEADSSYGEMPFDIADIDEEMSKYD